MREKEKSNFSLVADNSMKGKPLLPSLRQKKRYVVYDYISEKEIDNNKVFYAILHSFKELYGRLDFIKANIKKIEINEKSDKNSKINLKKNLNILRINNKYLNHLRLAIANIYEIDGVKINIHTITTTGILNKIKKILK